MEECCSYLGVSTAFFFRKENMCTLPGEFEDQRLLKMKDTLIYCDGVILFSAIDKIDEELFLCLITSEFKEYDLYIAIPLTKDEYKSYLENEVDLLSLFTNRFDKRWFDGVFTEMDDNEILLKIDRKDNNFSVPIPSQHLPLEGYFHKG